MAWIALDNFSSYMNYPVQSNGSWWYTWIMNIAQLTADEQRRMRTIFNGVMTKNGFLASLLRGIQRYPVEPAEVPTACVYYNSASDRVEMLYNPKWLLKHTDMQAMGIILHELYHVVFMHILSKHDCHDLWNAACDLCVNSIIEEVFGNYAKDELKASRVLPPSALTPGYLCEPEAAPAPKFFSDVSNRGEKNVTSDGREQELNGGGAPSKFDLIKIVQNLQPMKSAEVYYMYLMQKAADAGALTYVADGTTFDRHEKWGEGGTGSAAGTKQSSLDNEFARDKIRRLVGRAVRDANNESNGWGNTPADVRAMITSMIEMRIDWRSFLRQFANSLNRSDRHSTYRKINKRYPMIHPGIVRDRLPSLAVAVDMSGSVSDSDLEEVAAVLGSLTRKITVTVVPFDTVVRTDEIFSWRKGTKLGGIKRVACGGTDFNAPTNWINSPENRGKFDGLVICTDGECSRPVDSRVKRAWVIATGRKLLFDTNELVIKMNDYTRLGE